MIDVVLIGSGRWGKNYITTCKDFPLINLIVATRENWKSLIDKKPAGAIIATNPDSHIDIALYCLDRQVPVIIEKPLALTQLDACRLMPYSRNILVNHIHLFTDAYQNIKKLLSNSKITEIVTCGTGTVRRPYSNLHDYGVHDLSMILDLLKTMPTNVEFDRVNSKEQDFYNINMKFDETSVRCRVGTDVRKVRTLTVSSNDIHLHYNALNTVPVKNTPLHNVVSAFFDHITFDHTDRRMGIGLSLNILEILDQYDV